MLHYIQVATYVKWIKKILIERINGVMASLPIRVGQTNDFKLVFADSPLSMQD